eukprot:scaffold383_cov131-Skeletonema_marinoi.AAC.13
MTTANAYSAVQYGGFPDGMRVGLARKPKPMHFSIRIDDLEPFACRAHLNGHCSLEEEGCPFRCPHPLHQEDVDYDRLLSGTRENDQKKKKKKRRKLNSDNLRNGNEGATSSSVMPTTVTPTSSFEQKGALQQVGSVDDFTPSSSFEEKGSQSDHFSTEDVTDSSEYENETGPSSQPTEYLDNLLSKNEDCSCKEASCIECFSRAKKQLDEQKSDDSAESLYGKDNFTNVGSRHGHHCEDSCDHHASSASSEPLDSLYLDSLVAKWDERPKFKPERKSDPPEDWEDRSGVSMAKLEELRESTLKKLAPLAERNPDLADLVDYLSELVMIVFPGDLMFWILLHCAVQWSKGHISANLGGGSALGYVAMLQASGNCSLTALSALSSYFEQFSSIRTGFIADGLTAVNGNQGPCPTVSKRFARCPNLEGEDGIDVAEAMSITLGHFDGIEAKSFMFSAAGTTTGVNERILDKITSFNSSTNITICKEKKTLLNHIQHFRKGFEGQSHSHTWKRMNSTLQQVSISLQSHLQSKCGISPEETLFQFACDNTDLPIISNVEMSEESLEGLVGSSKQFIRDKIKAHCNRDKNALATDGPLEVQAYAITHFAEIKAREIVHNEADRRDLPYPNSAEDVRCGHILSNMGTNSWESKPESSRNEHMSAIASLPKKKSLKRKKSDDVSVGMADEEVKFERLERKKCTVRKCNKVAVQGGVCIAHGAVVKTKKCSVPTCNKVAVQGGVCVAHGAVVKAKKCSVPKCDKYPQQGGVCVAHGAVKKRKKCSVPTCDKRVVRGGVCEEHGATRKKCSVPTCDKAAVQGGVCEEHGATRKKCTVRKCNKAAVQGGVCIAHGAVVKTKRKK